MTGFVDWAVSQFEAKIVTEGKYEGKVCFKTPCARYTLSVELWEEIKKKINEV